MITPLRIRIVVSLVVILSLVASGLYWWQISIAEKQLRSETVAQAELRARQLNGAVAEQVAILIRYVDFAVQELASAYQPDKLGEFARQVERIGQRFPEDSLIQIAVIDAKGYLAYSNLGMKERVFLGDREHFKVHLGTGKQRLFISAPVLGRVSKQWSVQFTRPIRRNGRFFGVMVVSLSPEYLHKSLAALILAPDDTIAIFRQSGEYLARNRNNEDALGKNVGSNRPFVGADAAPTGSFRAKANFDNVLRLFEWQRLDDAPVVVATGLSEATLLAPVEAIIAGNRLQAAIATLVLWLLTLGAILLLYRLSSQQKLLLAHAQELDLASKELRASEQRLRTIIETEPECIKVVDSNGRLVEMNPAGLAMLEADSLQEAQQKTLLDYVDPDYRRAFMLLHRSVMNGESGTLEFKVTGLKGTSRILETHATPMRDDNGGISLLLGITRDITERKRSELLIRQSEQRFKTLADATFEGIVISADGKILDCNDQLTRILGYDRSEIIGQQIAKFIAPEDIGKVNSNLRLGGDVRIDHSMIRKDGASIVVEAHGKNIEQDGSIIRITSIRDITERTRLAAEIKKEKEKFEMLIQTSGDGIHILDPAGNVVEVNEKFCEMLGYTRDELLRMNVVEWDAKFSPEEIWPVIENNFRLANVFETRHRRQDGTIFDVEISTKAVEIEGRILLWNASRDISERKRSEESLRLAGMVYDNSAEAIVTTDADNNIVAVNPAFTSMTGYTAAEVIGKNPKILSSGRQGAEFYRGMWHELNEHGKWQGEIWNRRKDGDIYAEQLSINTIYTEDGKVHRRIGLFLDVTEKKKSDETIWKQANFDTLTGLPNRRMLYDRLEQEIRKAHRAEGQLALLFIDLDRFKEINDTLGHHVGDELLVEAGKRLNSAVRETDTVARLGGDEFTVVLTDVKSARDIEQVAQNIIKCLAQPYQLGADLVFASASLGIAVYPEDSTNIDQLMQYADQAMYEAKEQGRNRFSYFTPAMQGEAQNRLRLITELGKALPENQFRVYFQPIVELGSGCIFKAEALLRWQHPERGLVSPMTFIPLAEETGLIIEIGDWVFHEAAQWAARWNSLSSSGFQVSVNKSPVQFRNKDANEGITWPAYLYKLGLTGRNIAVEITEGMLLNQDKSTGKKLLQFRDAGIQVSIDDFGTGYSALSYLKRFDIDYLKIDMSFVRNIANDPADQALCEAIVVMAHKLGLKVIAEGVETMQQRDLLMEIGCDFAQGYLFGKPMPGEELDAILRSDIAAQ